MKSHLLLALVSIVAFAAPDAKTCGDIVTTALGADVKIDSAKMVAATDRLREHCDVRGVIWPENKFVVKLPTSWNNRFLMPGNGGWAGVLSIGFVDQAVANGYAAASTDNGHDAQKEPGAIFALAGATNPHASRKVIDHGYLSVHKTVLLAKKVIHAYYGDDPRYAYWFGCSEGGRQGLMEAQRYPEDFDGYVIGAPALNLTGANLKAIYNWIAVGPGEGQLKTEKLPALAEAVYKKCDALDGLTDGLIESPLKCGFDPARDLPRCAAGKDEPDCFTPQQIAALKKVYEGPRDSAGTQLFPGMPVGGEALTPDRNGQMHSGWETSLKRSFDLADTFMKYMAFEPPRGANWDYRTYDFDRDPPKMAAVGLRIDATIPDLTAVKARGAKIVHYHGWADPSITVKISVEYYEAARKTMGVKETEDFYRFFPVPGMFHCAADGPGCSNADWLQALVNWVEKGVAPTMIVGAHVEAGKTARTRPICMYPQAAQYKGTGSIDAAVSFTCTSQP